MLVLGAVAARSGSLAPHMVAHMPSPHMTPAPMHSLAPPPAPPPAPHHHRRATDTVIVQPWPQQVVYDVSPSCPYGTAWDDYSQACVAIATAPVESTPTPTATKRSRRGWVFLGIVFALGGIAGALLSD